jgi:hypothetical protein
MINFIDIYFGKLIDAVWGNIWVWRTISLITLSEIGAILFRKDLLSRWIFQTRYHAHDLMVFQKFDKKLPELILKDYLEKIKGSHSLIIDTDQLVADYLQMAGLQENEYLILEIRAKAVVHFCALGKLSEFIMTHFFSDNGVTSSLYPDMRKSADIVKYDKYARELELLTVEAYKRYADFRSEIKQRLIV